MNIFHLVMAVLVLVVVGAVIFGVQRAQLAFNIVVGLVLVILLLMPHLQM